MEAEYDFVAIIDGLPEPERQSYRISGCLKQLIEDLGLSCELEECNTKRGLIAALQHFRTCARTGKIFCLHFVCHGSENGLWLKGTNESIDWRAFRR